VDKNPITGTCRYNTIADAIAYIPLPTSAAEPWLIQVAPGVYEEEALIVPDYVTISGSSPDACIIQAASNAVTPIVTLGVNSAIIGVTVRGTGAAGQIGINHPNGANNSITHFVKITNCEVGTQVDNAQGVNISSVQWSANTLHDLTVTAPTATANIVSAVLDPEGVSIANGATVALSANTITDGTLLKGPLLHGQTVETATDISPLIDYGNAIGVISGGTIVPGETALTVAVAAGEGYLMVAPVVPDTKYHLQYVKWDAQTVTVPDSSSSYLYVDENGAVQNALTLPAGYGYILLGQAYTINGGVLWVQQTPRIAAHTPTNLDATLESGFGPIYVTGSLVSEDPVGSGELVITAGNYLYGADSYAPTGQPIPGWQWNAFYHNAPSTFTTVTQSVVDDANYDNGTGLTAIPAGQFARHGFYIVGDGAAETYMLVYAQTTYTTLADAENGVVPTPPSNWSGNISPIASIIVEQGNGIQAIMDERPRIGFAASAVTTPAIHGNLFGLLADDHPQYLPINGVRGMQADLVMTNQTAVQFNDAATHTASVQAPAAITTSYTLNLPVAPGAASTILTTDGNNPAQLSWATVNDLNAIAQGGNSFGAPITMGTNDNFGVNLETNGTDRLTISNTGAVAVVNDLTVGNGLTVTTGGATVTAGGLTVAAGGAAITGNSSVTGTFSASGNTTVGGTLAVTGASTLAGLTAGASTLDSAAITNNAAVGGTLDVTGAATFDAGMTLTNQGSIVLRELAENGTDAVSLQAPAALEASYTFTLPANAGTADYILATDGNGTTSWVPVADTDSITQGGNTFGAPIVIGSQDDFGMNFITNNTTRLSIDNEGSVSVVNDVTVGNGLTVTTGGATIDGLVTAQAGLAVSGAASTISYNGNGTTLTVSNTDVSLEDTNAIALAVTGSAGATAATITAGALQTGLLITAEPGFNALELVSGNITVTGGNVTVAAGDLSVGGNTSLTGTLGVTGATTLASTLTAGATTLDSAVVTTNATVGGTLDVTGAATFDADVTLTNQGSVVLNELAINGTDAVSLQAPAALDASYTFTLPADAGSANYVLITDGNGVTSWSSTGGIGSILQGGNEFGEAVVIGSNDEYGLQLKTNNTTALTIDTDQNATFAANLAAAGTLSVTGASTLTGNTSVGGTFSVEEATTLAGLTAGDSTLNSVIITTNATVGGTLGVTSAATLSSTLAVTGDYSSTDGNITLTNGNITLNTGDLAVTAGNAAIGGTLDVTGATTLGGLTAGASTLDSAAVTNNATVGGTLEVTGATTLAATSATTLSTSGTATLDSVDVTNNAGVGGTLWVTGAATFGAGATLTNNGALVLSELTENGTDAISVQAPAALDGSYTFTLPADSGTANYVLITDGNGTTSWSSTGGIGSILQGGNEFGEAVTIGSNDDFNLNLETNGITRLTVDNTGAVTIVNDLTIEDGLVVTASGASITGNSTVTGTFSASGNTSVGGTFSVEGASTLAGLTAGASTLDSVAVTNNATVGGTLEVTGATTLAATSATTLSTSGAATLASAEVTGNATVGGTFDVTGATTLAGLTAGASTLDSASVTNNATVGGALGVTGATTVTTVHATGAATFDAGATLTNNGALVLSELTENGTDAISLQAPASLDGSYTFTLPVDGGTANYVLVTDGAGTTSWAPVADIDSITQGGNSFGADVVIGSNDEYGLQLKTNNTTALTIDTDQNAAFAANLSAAGTLNVTGASTLAGLTAGASTLDSASITNNATVGGTLGVTGATTLASTLGVTGAATLSSTLNVADLSTLSNVISTSATNTPTVTISNTDATIGDSNAVALSVTGNAYAPAVTVVGTGTDVTTPVMNLSAADAGYGLIISGFGQGTGISMTDVGTTVGGVGLQITTTSGTSDIDPGSSGTAVTLVTGDYSLGNAINITTGSGSTGQAINIETGSSSAGTAINVVSGPASTGSAATITTGLDSTGTAMQVIGQGTGTALYIDAIGEAGGSHGTGVGLYMQTKTPDTASYFTNYGDGDVMKIDGNNGGTGTALHVVGSLGAATAMTLHGNTADTALAISGGGTHDLTTTGGAVIGGALTGQTVYAAGDLGGVAGQTALTNATADTVGALAHYIKIYIGTTAYYIPCYAAA
jgi:hypothetical protein